MEFGKSDASAAVRNWSVETVPETCYTVGLMKPLLLRAEKSFCTW
ncbi:hypothetical protein SAMN05443661_15318 [Natronobacterium gregoryi]|uniref:Uncharacterized protein n=1 Tax=Natronobacterium gregoryi TaxID=44930 RepID=A0A1I3T874_9EURY|nr:hypothetical protein SAMN05443661_15318 [Natronobacterium gregoryi]